LFQISVLPKDLLSGISDAVIKIIFALFTLLLGLIIGKLMEKLLTKVLKEIELNDYVKKNLKIKVNAEHLISIVVSYVIYFLAIVASLEQLGVVNTVLTIIALITLGILFISFFLTAREFIPNFTAGLYLYRKERLEEGSYVEIGDLKGEIIKIDLFHVKILAKNGDLLYIPNITVLRSEIKVRKNRPKQKGSQ